MKKIISLIIITLFCFGCQEVVDVELTDNEPRLVIDAYLNIFKNNNGTYSYSEGGVYLTLSAPYFDEEIQTVSNAEVYITNLNNKSIINLSESETPGLFTTYTTEFIPEYNTDYELTVIYNSETYTSTTQFIPSTPITSLEQGDGILFDSTDKEVIISYTDDLLTENYYMFDLDFSIPPLLSEDTFYQGQEFNFSYYYEDEELEDQEITIKLFGVDENYYNYFNLVLEQGTSDVNPFQTAPALIKGNIVNITNNENYPLGYFRISEAYTNYITITE